MVESIGTQDAANRDLEERYRALEEAYAAQHWSHVIRLGENLLSALKGNQGLVPELRPRTQVLIAHAYLYGLSDRDAAEDLYSAVISSRCDPALRQIAAAGLQACNQPVRPARQPQQPSQPQPAVAPGTTTIQPDPGIAGAAAGSSPAAMAPLAGVVAVASAGLPSPAMPWLAESGNSLAAAAAAAPPAGSLAGGTSSAAPWLEQAVAAPAPAEEPPITAITTAPPPSSPAAATLIPEVIEEPELIEVHQADPVLADPVDLTITAADRQLPAEPELRDDIPAPSRLLDPSLIEEAVQTQGEAVEPPALEVIESSPQPQELDGLPFRGGPINDPDADLAAGLLRVVIR